MIWFGQCLFKEKCHWSLPKCSVMFKLSIETRPSSSVHVEPSLGRWEKKCGVGIPTCLCKRDVAVGFYLG